METMIQMPITGNQFGCNYKFAPREDFDYTYRRVHQAANLISYNKNPHSVAREDFALKCLEPKENRRTANIKCMQPARKSLNVSENKPKYENINPPLLQKLDGTSSTFKRVTPANYTAPASRYQKYLTAKDYHTKKFDINDSLKQYMDGRAISGPGKEASATFSSTLNENDSFNQKPLHKLHDYRKDVDKTKCTFLRVMQAVDWKRPEPVSKTIYETDYISKPSNSPSRIIDKSFMNPSDPDGESSHICNDVHNSSKHFKDTVSSRMNCSNDSRDNKEDDFRRKRGDLPHYICKKETHLPKSQYSEPLFFPPNHSEMTTPLVNVKDVGNRWSQIMENTQAKHKKISLKLDGKCLPCYKKNMSGPEKGSGQSHRFVPPTTSQVLDNCKDTKWVASLENANPNYFRRDDFADSTDKRVYQAADRVISEEPPLSETAESLQRTVALLPEAKAAERKASTAEPTKAKSYLEFVSPNVGEFPFTKESYFRSSDLRNIITGDAYLGYDQNLKSVTKSDFNPKISYENGTDCRNPMNFPQVQYRKVRSQFSDLQCPKREGIIKFMDDEDLSLLRNHRR